MPAKPKKTPKSDPSDLKTSPKRSSSAKPKAKTSSSTRKSTSAKEQDDIEIRPKRKPKNYAFNTEGDDEVKPKRKPVVRKAPAKAKPTRLTASKPTVDKGEKRSTRTTDKTKVAPRSVKPKREITSPTADKDRSRPARPSFKPKSDSKYAKPKSTTAFDPDLDKDAKRPSRTSDKEKTGTKSTKPAILIDGKAERPFGKKPHRKGGFQGNRKSYGPGRPKSEAKSTPRKKNESGIETIRLNKYLANAGIASRRESDELIKSGLVEVNGKVITEMGYQVMPGDVVRYAGDKLSLEKPIYVLLNKPKDYITSGTESANRRSVFQLLRGVGQHRMWPVGKLDRNTTGLLLFTNDDAITKKLSLPRQGIKKVYHVFTDKNVKKDHLQAMMDGVETADGWLKVSNAAFVTDALDKKQVGLEIHGGRSRTARLIFEHFDYQVLKLDRVIYAGLTKKDLARGRWRHLSQQEIAMLKML